MDSASEAICTGDASFDVGGIYAVCAVPARTVEHKFLPASNSPLKTRFDLLVSLIGGSLPPCRLPR